MLTCVCGQRAFIQVFPLRSSIFLLGRRHAATKASRLPPSSPRTPSATKAAIRAARQDLYQDATRTRLLPQESRKLFSAERMYNRGIHNVYRAPSHIGKLGISWFLGGLLISNSIWWVVEGTWKDGGRPGLSPGWKTVNETGLRLGIIMYTALGGYAILRFNGLVKSLDLVKRKPGNTVALRISVRRVVPFLTREYVVPPYALRLPRDWNLHPGRATLVQPDGRSERLGVRSLPRSFSRILWLVFSHIRGFFMKDGIVAVDFESDGKTRALLDASGKFAIDPTELDSIATVIEPWDR